MLVLQLKDSILCFQISLPGLLVLLLFIQYRYTVLPYLHPLSFLDSSLPPLLPPSFPPSLPPSLPPLPTSPVLPTAHTFARHLIYLLSVLKPDSRTTIISKLKVLFSIIHSPGDSTGLTTQSNIVIIHQMAAHVATFASVLHADQQCHVYHL